MVEGPLHYWLRRCIYTKHGIGGTLWYSREEDSEHRGTEGKTGVCERGFRLFFQDITLILKVSYL